VGGGKEMKRVREGIWLIYLIYANETRTRKPKEII
jgi:hypothetical protein